MGYLSPKQITLNNQRRHTFSDSLDNFFHDPRLINQKKKLRHKLYRSYAPGRSDYKRINDRNEVYFSKHQINSGAFLLEKRVLLGQEEVLDLNKLDARFLVEVQGLFQQLFSLFQAEIVGRFRIQMFNVVKDA